jgi:Protein of unknown function (DUF3568)
VGRSLALVLVCAAALAVAGCGGSGGESEEAEQDCGSTPAAMSGSPTLPTGFPSPSEVVYTGEEKEGPTTKVEGYWQGDLDSAYEGYKDALEQASGYSVTKDEQEEDDAEVNFEGQGTTGQVKLEKCDDDRTDVTVTVRPA